MRIRTTARRRRPSTRPAWIFGSLKASIIGLGAIASALAAIIGLVLIFFPGLKPHPCVGETTAQFTDVSVTRTGPLTVQASYTMETHGYAGQKLRVRWTLQRHDNGNIISKIPGFSDLPGATLEPSSCTADQGGEDLTIPLIQAGRYRIVLELFPPGQAARIARAMRDFTVSSAT
jgi:hypothetical protein